MTESRPKDLTVNSKKSEPHNPRKRVKPNGLPIIHERAAGIDIGSRFHVVAVSPELCDEPVQTFQAFTSDLIRMADGSSLLESRRWQWNQQGFTG
jgi:hypothetical protein